MHLSPFVDDIAGVVEQVAGPLCRGDGEAGLTQLAGIEFSITDTQVDRGIQHNVVAGLLGGEYQVAGEEEVRVVLQNVGVGIIGVPVLHVLDVAQVAPGGEAVPDARVLAQDVALGIGGEAVVGEGLVAVFVLVVITGVGDGLQAHLAAAHVWAYVEALQHLLGPLDVAAGLGSAVADTGLVGCQVFILAGSGVVDEHRAAGVTTFRTQGQGVLQRGT